MINDNTKVTELETNSSFIVVHDALNADMFFPVLGKHDDFISEVEDACDGNFELSHIYKTAFELSQEGDWYQRLPGSGIYKHADNTFHTSPEM